MSRRWRVELTRGSYQEVHANEIMFVPGGGITFWVGQELVVAYSPDGWLSVVPMYTDTSQTPGSDDGPETHQ